MVLRETRKRQTLVLLLVFVCYGLIGGAVFLLKPVGEDVGDVMGEAWSQDGAGVQGEKSAEESSETEVSLPDAIDLQPVVDAWADTIRGNKSVVIYDLDRDEISASYNANESFNTASLYKLFVVYEGYRRVYDGRWNGATMVGSTGSNVMDCLDYAVRRSDSPCAEGLWGMMGHAELDTIIKNDYGILNSNISKLLSNANDIAVMMKRFYTHPDFNEAEFLPRMKDSFLNQPKIGNNNWRAGLPSGFTRAIVYNKVGWDYNPSGDYWNIYHDASIVEAPELNRHFVVVVMTNRISNQSIAKLGTDIESLIYGW